MSPELLNSLVCPECRHGPLRLESASAEALQCDRCACTYPVLEGVPRLVPRNNYAASFGFQWTQHAATQLDSALGIGVSRERLRDVTDWPANLSGERVLEAGSGAGRFTEVLLTSGADVFSFDYSDAVIANQANNGASPRLHLFQGDIFRIPFAPRSFDRVVCLGVLQHTPDPRAAFRSLARQVRPGGHLAVDVYSKRLTSLLHWKYLLRPLTTRLDHRRLYRLISKCVPRLLPWAGRAHRWLGPVGLRIFPIAAYPSLGLESRVHEQWSILDTFDWYAPAHDHPQSQNALRCWFEAEGFSEVVVRAGINGVVGRGRAPA